MADRSIFDSLDSFSLPKESIKIRSYINGDSELIHITLLVQDVETENIGERESHRTTMFYIEGADDQAGLCYGQRLLDRRPFYQLHFTDLHRTSVPLEFISEMRVIDDKSLKDWHKRGVQVSDLAWGILESRLN